MKTITKLMLTLALAFAATTATAAAKKLEVKITNTANDFVRGYWVEYTINGVKYRSDQAAEAINQHAWTAMSDADKKKTVETVYSILDARNVQFGETFAWNMGYWYDKMKGWVDGKEILVDKLIDKDYPGLVDRFGKDWDTYVAEHFLSEYEKMQEPDPELAGGESFPVLDNLMARRNLQLTCARQAYAALENAEYARTAAAVKSTAGDLIQLICDKCLVPAITPTSAGGIGLLSAPDALGTALDYVNSLLGIQDNLIKNVVGERATAEKARMVIDAMTIAIGTNYNIIKECTKLAHETANEIDETYARLAAEKKAEYAKRAEERRAREQREKELVGTKGFDLGLKAMFDARLNDIAVAETNLTKAVKAHTKAVEELDRLMKAEWYVGIENDRSAAKTRVSNCLRDVEAKKTALETANTNYRNFIEKEKHNVEVAFDAFKRSAGQRFEAFNKNAKAIYATCPKLKIDAEKLSQLIFSNGIADDEIRAEAAEMASAISAWLDKVEEYEVKCDTDIEQAYYDLQQTVMTEYSAIKRKANVVGPTIEYPAEFNGSYPPAPDEEYDAAPFLYDPSGVHYTYGNPGGDALENFKRLYSSYLELLNGIGGLKAYDSNATKIKNMANECVNQTRAAMAEMESINKELSAIDESLPTFITEQEVSDGILVLDDKSELGRAFLGEDSTGTAETAAAYRDRLNSCMDSYNAKLAKFYAAHTKFVAYARCFRTSYVGEGLSGTTNGYSSVVGDFDRSSHFPLATPGVRSLRALHRDFNNRSQAHLEEMAIFGDLNEGRDLYTTNVIAHYDDPAYMLVEDPYLVKAVSAQDFARHTTAWRNPSWVIYVGGGNGWISNHHSFNRGLGSYAYYAKGYYETYFGDEPDPYEDLVKPLIEEIDAARAAYENAGVIPVIGPEPTAEDDEPEAAPTLFGPVTAELPFMGDATYNGWVRNADGSLAGLLTVKAAKAAKPEKGGQSKLTVTYTPFGGKKQTIKLPNDAMPVAGGVATVAIPGVGTVKFTGDALVGADVDVQAGKDTLKSKDRAEKAAATAAAASKAGVWTFALGTDAAYAAFSVTVDKKGKGKLAGTLPDGTKVSVSAQGVLGDGVLAIPFTYAKKGTLGFVFWVNGDGTATLSDLTGDVGGSPGTARPTMVAPSASHRLADGEHTFTAGGVSQGFTVAGKKWNVPKQNKRAEVDPNPTGLKLAFTEKTGAVKGTYTVVDGKAKTKYTVVGVVVGGRFYGSAYARNAVPLPATAE